VELNEIMLKPIYAKDDHNTPRLIAKVGLLLLLVIACLTIWSGSKYLEAASWRRHTDKVISEVRQLKYSLQSTIAHHRGYLLTSRPETLARYKDAKQNVFNGIESVRELVKDNSGQTANINRSHLLWQEKVALLDRANYLNTTDKEAAHAMLEDELLNIAKDGMFTSLTQIEDMEDLLLKQRTERAERNFKMTSTIASIGLLTAFVLFFISTYLLQKEIKIREGVEAELKAASHKALEASTLKSSFLANMSHEIRTPLNGIIGMSKLLEQTKLDEHQADYVDTIKLSSASLLALINDILDLSKIESGKFQLEETNFELSSLLKSTISIVDFQAKNKGISLVSELPANLPDFYLGDPLRIRQVLLNLLNNAIKFSDRGQVVLKVTRLTEDAESRAKLKFEIIDQGVGFDDDTKTKLFQTFSQGDDSTSRRYGGTGLGLSISKQIVEMMDGKIDVESVKGVGSKFYFVLDLKLAKYENDYRPVQTVTSIRHDLRGKILIAEDNRINQKVVAEMVRLLGCQFKVVENGQLCIEALKEDHYDLILMDGQMPVMDGYDATRAIRDGASGTQNRSIPILATTANAIKGDIEKCLEAGMNDYISKPISYSDLSVKIEKWLERGRKVVDGGAIEKLTKQEMELGKPLINELIDIFLEETPVMIDKMRTNLYEGKRKEIAAIAHSLKSSAAVLGALRMRDLTERIEKAPADLTDQQMTFLIDSIEKDSHLVYAELKHLKAPQSPPESEQKNPPPANA
jgi:Signal transduction histidine kinase